MAARTHGENSSFWTRLQQAIGLVPLSLYALQHLWRNWPALDSREAWLLRARSSSVEVSLGVCVIVLMAVHVILGVLRLLRARANGASPQDQGRSRFQAVTGSVLLVFVVYHVVQVWPAAGTAAHAAAVDGYQRLWQLAGRPIPLVFYVLGIGALAFHLAHGWARWLEEHAAASVRVSMRYAAGLAGVLLFVLYLQLVGRFALGEPVVPVGRAEAQEAVPQ